jgi:hypothetical protein
MPRLKARVWLPPLLLPVSLAALALIVLLIDNGPPDLLDLPLPKPISLSDIRSVSHKDRWHCQTSWKEIALGFSPSARWAFATPDGGFCYIDLDNSYLLGPQGELLQRKDDPIRRGNYLVNLNPPGKGALEVCLDAPNLGNSSELLARIAPAASQPCQTDVLWLDDSAPLMTMDDSGTLGFEFRGQQVPPALRSQLDYDYLEDTAVRPDGSLLISVADILRPGRLLALTSDGRQLWRCASVSANKLLPLPADSVLSGNNQGLECFDKNGRLQWRVRAKEQFDFDGYSFGVSTSGVIAARIAARVCFWHTNGEPAASPAELGVKLPWMVYDWRGLLVGADGRFYVQLKPPLRYAEDQGGNWVLAFDADGCPLWRTEFPANEFDLAAVGAQGELYGLRIKYGMGLSPTGTRDCEVVCIEISD